MLPHIDLLIISTPRNLSPQLRILRTHLPPAMMLLRQRSSSRIHTTRPSNLRLLTFDILERSSRKCRFLVQEDENIFAAVRMCTEVLVDIFESAACSLREEDVDYRHEREVEDCPDDVELPAEIADSAGGDFDDHKVAWEEC